MKVIITQKQLQQIRENTSKKFSCEGKNCEHSWKIEKEDKHPYLCHMCGYDSAKEKHNYDELENFWKNYKKKNLKESKKNDISNEEIKNITSILIDYATPEIKKYIKPYQPQLKDNDIVINYELNIHKNFDINNTKVIYVTLDIVNTDGNSIVIYEDNELDIIDLLFDYLKYMGIDNDGLYGYSFDFKRYHMKFKLDENKESEEKIAEIGYDIKGIKVALNAMSELSETYGEGIPLDFSLRDYLLKQNEGIRRPILQLFIDVNKKDGKEYKITQMYRHEISVELLGILEMFGLYNDERMSPYYNFHFNKKSSEDSFD
jgi:hypothetical protein